MQISKGSVNSRIAYTGASLTVAGTLTSGPLAFLAVSAIQPQPAWSDASVYVSNYHPIQSLTFYFGMLLLVGSVMMMASIHVLDGKNIKSLLALVFTSIACGLIAFNYLTEATFVPALVRHYTPSLDPIVSTFAVTNPSSLFWAIEMWGYGFLGLGTWFACGFFSGGGIESIAKILFVLNGIVSVIGAFWTGIRQEWVLSLAGLVAYAVWNALYLALAIVFLIVILRRRSNIKLQ